MNSDVGFTCQQLEKEEVYRIDNSKSSCTLFMIEGDVIFDLGKYKGLRILQKEMVFIPQSIETQIKSMTGSKCILLFWDRNVSVCDKLFLGSLSVRGEDRTADNFILPVRKPLAGKVALQTYAFTKAAGTAFGSEGFLYKERIGSVLFYIDRY